MIDFTSKRMKIDLSFPEEKLQKCPLCGMGHPMYINGYIRDYHTDKKVLHPYKGYSFCNCRNIWYTNWENLKKDIYNDEMKNKYGQKEYKDISRGIFNKRIVNLFEHKKDIKSFLELGCGNFVLLDLIKDKLGWQTTAVDINNTFKTNKHNLILGDIEDNGVIKQLEKYDVIWASHVIEHLKDPLRMIREYKKHLNKDGLFCVAMPDPFFINFIRPDFFGHWHLEEHHIMWDLGSFKEELEKIGYKIELAIHCPSVLSAEFYLVAKNVGK